MSSILQVVLVILTGVLTLQVGAQELETEVLAPIEIKAAKRPKVTVQISESSHQNLESNSQDTSSLTQVLQNSPSVFVQENGTQVAPTVILRAQDPKESRYYLEGVPLTEAQFNSDAIAVLPFSSIGSLDVYPDNVPAGLLSDGLGGAVDFHLVEKVTSGVGAKTGSYGYSELTGKTSFSSEERNLSLNLVRSNEDFTYFDDGGTPFNPDLGSLRKREHNRYLRVGIVPNVSLYRRGAAQIKYFGIHSYRELQIPGPVSLPMNGQLIQWYHLSAVRFQSNVGDFWQTKNTVYARLNSENYQSENKMKSLSSPSSNQTWNQALGIRSQWQNYRWYPVLLETSMGGSFENYQLEQLTSQGEKIQNQRWDFPLSVAMSVPTKFMELKPAILVQGIHYGGRVEKAYVLASPRLGLNFDHWLGVRNLTSQVLIGSFYRAPSMFELNGTSLGFSAAPELLPEFSKKISAGLGYSLSSSPGEKKKFQVSYNYTLAVADNLITYLENSQNTRVATNIGKSLIQSHEINCEWNFLKDFYTHTELVFLMTRNLSQVSYYFDKEIPNRPEQRWVEKLGYRNHVWGLSYQWQWVGKRYWDLANQKSLNSFADHGLSFQWSPKHWGILTFDVFNIFDTVTAYSQAAGFQTVDNTTGYLGYPAPGRRFYLGWQYEL
jgi:iron complex outermembrane recepter protein